MIATLEPDRRLRRRTATHAPPEADTDALTRAGQGLVNT